MTDVQARFESTSSTVDIQCSFVMPRNTAAGAHNCTKHLDSCSSRHGIELLWVGRMLNMYIPRAEKNADVMFKRSPGPVLRGHTEAMLERLQVAHSPT
jgi:hypothetical protein